MDLQVLVSTMNQNNHSLLEKMNIQSDAIIINQTDYYQVDKFRFKENTIQFLSFSERGIGLSRNNALMRATADIVLFADDDVKYVNNYKEIILNGFDENPAADIIIFNVPSTNPERPQYFIKNNSRVRMYNSLKFGAVSIAVRTDKIRKVNIYFSLLFGGGAKYSAGEDSLFLADCIKAGLKVYTNSNIIGYVSQEDSSWFKGYNEKYFFDKGVFYATLSKKWGWLLCLQFAIRHKKLFRHENSITNAIKLMLRGVKYRQNN